MPETQKNDSRDLARTSTLSNGAISQRPNQVAGAIALSPPNATSSQNAIQAAIAVHIQGLSPDQQKTLESLATGRSVLDTCLHLGIARSTFYHWLKRDPVFRAAYNSWHEVMEEGCRAKLATLMDKATIAVERQLDAGNAKFGMQLLVGLGMVKPRHRKITDPDTLRRKKAVRQRKRDNRLKDAEYHLGLRQRVKMTP
jgi:hypothetical protein